MVGSEKPPEAGSGVRSMDIELKKAGRQEHGCAVILSPVHVVEGASGESSGGLQGNNGCGEDIEENDFGVAGGIEEVVALKLGKLKLLL
jgi:hypothetical protein